MAGNIPKVVVLGHSFVKRLKNDLDKNFDHQASRTFGLVGTAVGKLKSYDLHVVRQLMPDIVILEVGTNDLPSVASEVVGSSIEDLEVTCKSIYSVAVVCVGHVIPRGQSTVRPLYFWERGKVLQQYPEVVLDSLDFVLCWRYKAFTRPDQDFYLRDGVYLNARGQYLFYRSYRGAILTALSYL